MTAEKVTYMCPTCAMTKDIEVTAGEAIKPPFCDNCGKPMKLMLRAMTIMLVLASLGIGLLSSQAVASANSDTRPSAVATAPVDTEPPTVVMVNPPDELEDEILSELDDGVQVLADVGDPSGIATVTWLAEGQQGEMSFDPARGLYRGLITEGQFHSIVDSLSDQDFTLTIRATDSSGNVAEASKIVEIEEPWFSILKH